MILIGMNTIVWQQNGHPGFNTAICIQYQVDSKGRPDLSYFCEDCETVLVEIKANLVTEQKCN